jgi:hypothetical protein
MALWASGQVAYGIGGGVGFVAVEDGTSLDGLRDGTSPIACTDGTSRADLPFPFQFKAGYSVEDAS